MLMTRPGQSSWNNKNKRKHLHVCIRIDNIVDFLKTKSKIRKIKEVKFESSIIVIFCTETITQTIETFGFFSKAYSIHRYRHTFMHTSSSLQSFLCGNRDERALVGASGFGFQWLRGGSTWWRFYFACAERSSSPSIDIHQPPDE